MAIMIPEKYLESKLDVRGEKKFYIEAFYQLDEYKNEDFYVINNLEYLAVDEKNNLIEGEADFIVIHRELGMLFLEVKGGEKIEVRNDNHYKEFWVSTNKYGKEFSIKNPFLQAKKNQHQIIKKISEKNIFGVMGDEVPINYGFAVCFPDCDVSSKNYKTYGPKDIVIQSSDFNDLKKRIIEIMTEWKRANKKTKPITKKIRRAIIDEVIAPKFNLTRNIKADIDDEYRYIIRLTKEQNRLLIDYMGSQNRLLIEGYAGTGKTVIAMLKAEELAKSGQKILFLCFNQLLGKHIENTFFESPNVTACHFHKFCTDEAKKANIELEIPENEIERQKFWNEDVVYVIMKLIDKNDLKYDTIIIDEGQDFKENWWAVIEDMLKDKEQSNFYIFYDPYQNVLKRENVEDNFPLKNSKFTLKRNLRNTKKISTYIGEVTKLKISLPTECVEGKEITTQKYNNENHQKDIIHKIIENLVIKNQIEPKDIVILSPYNISKSCLKGVNNVNKFRITNNVQNENRDILFETIKRFKGLESKIVIMTDLSGKKNIPDKTDIYVGASRAINRLYLIHDRYFKYLP